MNADSRHPDAAALRVADVRRRFDAAAPELYGAALKLTGRAAEAEDLLQATWLAAIEGARRYDPARPLRPWLGGSALRAISPGEAR